MADHIEKKDKAGNRETEPGAEGLETLEKEKLELVSDIRKRYPRGGVRGDARRRGKFPEWFPEKKPKKKE